MPSQKSAPDKIHFIGIGGIGISALARWFLAQGWAVSGSDLQKSDLTEELVHEGASIKVGHRKTNVPKGLSMAIYSNAITPGSSGYLELEEVRKMQIRPMSYPQTVGCLTEVYKTVSVSGSHGKSTTTAMIGLILKDSPIQPTIIVGTKLKELHGKNFWLGENQNSHTFGWLVLEADEWRGAFLHYHPDIAVITNIDREHLDFYKDLNDLKRTFLKFMTRVKPGGSLVLNRDDKNLFSLSPLISKIAKKSSLKMYWYSVRSTKDASRVKKHLKLPGKHNLSNALAALTVTRDILHIPEKNVLAKLGSYSGAWRRMEFKGELKTKNRRLKTRIEVYDDYAHHPTEIQATLQAFREKFPGAELVTVFEPHQAKRLKALYKEFTTAFHDTDQLILLPVYEVAGRDNKEAVFTSEKLARDIKKKYPKKTVLYLANPKKLKELIAQTLPPRPPDVRSKKYSRKSGPRPLRRGYPPNPVIIMMGAGSVANLTPLLFK
ncbi:MAG: UDP-N-acetylmuramate--L-alanine ligase [Patescibacteria group bacterium]